MNTISNGKLSDPLFVSVNRGLTLVRLALFELRNLTKMKYTTDPVCQRNSYETARQNFLKLCSNEGHNV